MNAISVKSELKPYKSSTSICKAVNAKSSLVALAMLRIQSSRAAVHDSQLAFNFSGNYFFAIMTYVSDCT
jgi:hypothetical protein